MESIALSNNTFELNKLSCSSLIAPDKLIDDWENPIWLIINKKDKIRIN